MRIKDLSELEKFNITRDFVAHGTRFTMDKYVCTQQQIKTVAFQARKIYTRQWCSDNNATPRDLAMVLCIIRWMPIDKKLRFKYMRFFDKLGKDYDALIRKTDSSLYGFLRSVPNEYKVCFVEGLITCKCTTEMVESIPMDHSVLRRWQRECEGTL